MIEIIKQGTKNRVECDNCGALLSYTLEDVKSEERYITQRDSYTQKYITCPQCMCKLVLEGAR